MTMVLVDTNIFIDLFGPPSAFLGWSSRQLIKCRSEGQLVISPIIWAELAGLRTSEADLTGLMARLDLVREALPFSAAYEAGCAHMLYRKNGGLREKTLPDFFIGAHALVKSHRLLTRDAARYRAYFPSVDLISSETHP